MAEQWRVKTFALADDLSGAAAQAVTAIREFGGDVHLLAIAVAGLEPRKAHWLTRPPFGGNRLFGVAATTYTDIWAVGYVQRAGGDIEGLILHYDGHSWQS